MDLTKEIQIDFQKVMQRYNTQIGEMAGRIILLEAEIETLKDFISQSSAKNVDVRAEKPTPSKDK